MFFLTTFFANVRGSYSVSTGLFTAPYTGLYEFNYHAVTLEGERLNLGLESRKGYYNLLISLEKHKTDILSLYVP